MTTKPDLNTRRQVRQIANADSNIPVEVVDGDQAPKREGQGFGWETRGGTPIRHPSAYARKGWSNIVYVRSTRCVTVGREWLAKHMGRESWQVDLQAVCF
jgi:hypothetical protein